MKKITFIALIMAIIGSLAFTAPQAGKFQWSKTTYDFGSIPQGVPKSVEFTFTNIGDSPIVIEKVKGSCGCTATDYTKTPIPPGQKGKVVATYNAASVGNFTKTVTVTANTPENNVTLYIKGQVVQASN